MEKTTNRKIKSIAFNFKGEGELLKFAETKDNFSDWVKEKIREELYGVRMNINDIRNIIREEMPTRETIMPLVCHDKQEDEKISIEENVIEYEDDMLM